ncbi:MAG TPA: hypothetical protein VMI75_03490 [Polyangiaceae bacterium]|nr:hypothetical protein [Polyangiaceae bacterium]
MAGSPKKRARRLAAEASRAGARARGGPVTTALVEAFRGAFGAAIPPVPPERVPSDEELLRIAKGVLLSVARHGEPGLQVRAAWNLADVARRDVKAPKALYVPSPGDPLDAMSDEELAAQAAEAERVLRSPVQ